MWPRSPRCSARRFYKPLAPLSGLLAIALLAGGLAVLMLDLGRADRMIVAHDLLQFQVDLRLQRHPLQRLFHHRRRLSVDHDGAAHEPLTARPAGFAAFIWRLVLTTGTGSIFGFLVARQAYDSALLAPMFIVMSFSYGLAVYLLVLIVAYRWSGRTLGDAVLARLKKLLIGLSPLRFISSRCIISPISMSRSSSDFERFILLTAACTRLCSGSDRLRSAASRRW